MAFNGEETLVHIFLPLQRTGIFPNFLVNNKSKRVSPQILGIPPFDLITPLPPVSN
jgi:hypothetical protein